MYEIVGGFVAGAFPTVEQGQPQELQEVPEDEVWIEQGELEGEEDKVT